MTDDEATAIAAKMAKASEDALEVVAKALDLGDGHVVVEHLVQVFAQTAVSAVLRVPDMPPEERSRLVGSAVSTIVGYAIWRGIHPPALSPLTIPDGPPPPPPHQGSTH